MTLGWWKWHHGMPSCRLPGPKLGAFETDFSIWTAGVSTHLLIICCESWELIHHIYLKSILYMSNITNDRAGNLHTSLYSINIGNTSKITMHWAIALRIGTVPVMDCKRGCLISECSWMCGRPKSQCIHLESLGAVLTSCPTHSSQNWGVLALPCPMIHQTLPKMHEGSAGLGGVLELQHLWIDVVHLSAFCPWAILTQLI